MKNVAKTVPVIRRLSALRNRVAKWRADGQSVALLPTMGALHEGHRRLARLAKRKCDKVVVSIFVNPEQFAPNEDLARYPRDEAGDLAMLGEEQTDLVWAPTLDVMYPDGFATQVIPGGAAQELETEHRPQFFTGVVTVCTKLFIQVAPDIAVFGEKDYQQLQVIRQLVRDLDMPMKIVGAPTVRDRDGLALSSRNKYLSASDREIAPLLNAQIVAVAQKVADGGRISTATASAARTLTKAGFDVDYLEVRNADTLAPVPQRTVTKRATKSTASTSNKDKSMPASMPAMRVLAAARLGKTRLIDNCRVR